MDIRYYLSPSKYEGYNIASIFQLHNGNLTDFKSNNFIKLLNDVPKDWHEIYAMEAWFLILKNDKERINVYNENMFQKIDALLVNDQCYYFDGYTDKLCTIHQKFDTQNGLEFVILSEFEEYRVSAAKIILITTKIEQAEEIEEIMELLLNPNCDIQNYDIKKRCVLSLVYKLKSKNYFKMVVNEYNKKFEINKDIMQPLLRSIVKDRQWGILDLVLSKCIIRQLDNEFLMNLALDALKQGYYEVLCIVFRFIAKTDKLKNGETFVTNLFKENIGENTIKKVIEMGFFDLNSANAMEETPLILACERLMAELVNVLLQYGSDVTFKNHAAVEIAVFAKAKHPLKEAEANVIKELLMKPVAGRAFNPPIHEVIAVEDQPMEFGEQSLINIMSLLLANSGNILEMNENNECAFCLAYPLDNRRFFKMFIRNCRDIDIIGNPVTESILSKMIVDNELNLLDDTLNVAIIEEIDDDNLLTLALQSVMANKNNFYRMIAKRCTDRNAMMKNNETFLTSLFKNNITEDLIFDVIKSKYFDINKLNGYNETAIILACERFMPVVVDVLLKYGADISCDSYQAVDRLVTSEYKKDDLEIRAAAKIKILNLISGKKEGKEKNLHFVVDKIVDINKIWSADEFKCHVRIGDPVEIRIDLGNRKPEVFSGQVKWIGTINNEKCVGVDLGEDFPYGMNGIITEKCKFDCLPGHGIVTALHNVKRGVPFKLAEIGKKERLFADLNINSKVVHYNNDGDKLRSVYGIVRCSVVDNNNCYLYGIELEEKDETGTDGKFKGIRLFHCQPNHGILVSVKTVAPDPRLFVQEVDDNDIVQSNISDICQYCLPKTSFIGNYKGIQGNKHSTFMESIIFSLFAKSESLDYIISPLLDDNRNVPITTEIKECMAWNIIYPLREFGFVSFHRIKQMKNVIKKCGPKFENIMKNELDMADFANVLTMCCPNEPLLRFITFNNNFNNSMFLHAFLTLDRSLDYISFQELLEISMAQNEMMFHKPPTCLIIEVPRNDVAHNLYRNVLPQKTLNISNLSFNYFKRCCICNKMAVYQCKRCVEKNRSLTEGFFCETDKCLHHDLVAFPLSEVHSKSEVLLNLRSIISLDNRHSVVYVKDNDLTNEWLYFDSRKFKDEANNSSIPTVTIKKEVMNFLNMEVDDMLTEVKNNTEPEIASLLSNSYIFLYENPSVTCY